MTKFLFLIVLFAGGCSSPNLYEPEVPLLSGNKSFTSEHFFKLYFAEDLDSLNRHLTADMWLMGQPVLSIDEWEELKARSMLSGAMIRSLSNHK